MFVCRDTGASDARTARCDRMLNHHCRRNPELQEELQIQAAVAAGDVYTVRKMLEQGYSPKIRDANGWTLLHFSAAKGKERCVRVFLEHGGKKFGCFSQWGDGQVWFNVSLCKKISWMTSLDWHLFKLWLACWRWLLKESVLPKNVHYVTYPKVIRALYYYPYF